MTDAMNQENMIINITQEWMRLCNNISDFEVCSKPRALVVRLKFTDRTKCVKISVFAR